MKKFENPKIDVTVFSIEDIIATSNVDFGDGNTGGDGGIRN